MRAITAEDQAGWTITVIVPIGFRSSREAAQFVQRALSNALSETGHAVEPVIFYELQDGKGVRVTEAI